MLISRTKVKISPGLYTRVCGVNFCDLKINHLLESTSAFDPPTHDDIY